MISADGGVFEPYHKSVDEVKADKLLDSTSGDIASLDTSGNLADSGVSMFGDKTYDFADVLEVKNALPVPAKSYAVKVKAKQDLHGLPFPYVGGAYKNKLYIPPYNYTDHGITVIVDDKGIAHVSGTLEEGTFLHGFVICSNFLVKAGTYILSGSTYPENALIYLTDMSDTYIAGTYDGGNTFMLSSDTYIKVYIFVYSDHESGVYDETIYPMLRLATETDPTFAPYENICPIIGKTKSTIKRNGSSIFDEVYPNIDGTIRYRQILVGDGNYTLSTTAPKSDATSAVFFFLGGAQNSGADNAGNVVWNGRPVSVKAQNGYVTIAYRIEHGVDPQGYITKLVKNETLPEINFGKTVYDGEFDSDGNLRDDDGMVTDDSISNITTVTSSGGMYWSEVPVSANAKIGGNAISSHLPYVSDGNIAWIMQEPCFTVNADGGIRIYTDESTVEGLKARLANLQICYELATPTTTQIITPEITLSKGDNAFSADSGQMSMTVGGMADALESASHDNVQSDWNESDTSSDAYIKNKPTLGTAASKDVPASGNASTNQVVLGSDSRLNDARTPTSHQHTGTSGAPSGTTTAVTSCSVNGSTLEITTGSVASSDHTHSTPVS